ncbi:MAG: DUF502 domain-containing protein [Arcobacteraceae bacterium]|jgi:uncharacterized membrane protein|nr:DUF502 domain-containing protein [Arcobacteraceae bacterium]
MKQNLAEMFKFFLVGALAVIPLFVVVQVLLWVQSIGVGIFDNIFSVTNNSYASLLIIILVIGFLIFIGYSIEKVGKSLLINFIDDILQKLPAIGKIYAIVKKITDLFKTNANSEKKEVVLVEYPRIGLWVPAYVLNKYDDVYSIFIPTSPNPTSGYAILVEKSMVKSTTLTIAEASQFIVSMGADFIKKEELSVIIKEANIANNQNKIN